MDQEHQKLQEYMKLVGDQRAEIERLRLEVARLRTLVKDKLQYRDWNTDFAGNILPTRW